jgi:hypothetical protein
MADEERHAPVGAQRAHLDQRHAGGVHHLVGHPLADRRAPGLALSTARVDHRDLRPDPPPWQNPRAVPGDPHPQRVVAVDHPLERGLQARNVPIALELVEHVARHAAKLQCLFAAQQIGGLHVGQRHLLGIGEIAQPGEDLRLSDLEFGHDVGRQAVLGALDADRVAIAAQREAETLDGFENGRGGHAAPSFWPSAARSAASSPIGRSRARSISETAMSHSR